MLAGNKRNPANNNGSDDGNIDTVGYNFIQQPHYSPHWLFQNR